MISYLETDESKSSPFFLRRTPDLPNLSDQVYNQIRDVKANES